MRHNRRPVRSHLPDVIWTQYFPPQPHRRQCGQSCGQSLKWQNAYNLRLFIWGCQNTMHQVFWLCIHNATSHILHVTNMQHTCHTANFVTNKQNRDTELIKSFSRSASVVNYTSWVQTDLIWMSWTQPCYRYFSLDYTTQAVMPLPWQTIQLTYQFFSALGDVDVVGTRQWHH